MKALVCTRCVDIRALSATRAEGGWDSCHCGRVRARWIDPQRGTVEVLATDRSCARILGIHNGFLRLTVVEPALSHHQWREAVADLVDNADGYLFHASVRACPVALIRIGETTDCSWAQEPVS